MQKGYYNESELGGGGLFLAQSPVELAQSPVNNLHCSTTCSALFKTIIELIN